MTVASLRLGPVLRHVGPTHATVWVETTRPCTVEVLEHRASTFTVAGHHYAVVVVRGLEPGSVSPYQVTLDGSPVWPLADSGLPPSTIRTPDPAGPVRISFGSCRYASPATLAAESPFGPCALDALARRLVGTRRDEWPDLLLLLGDQVYADETTSGTRARIAARRGDSPPHGEVRDFEEYTWLYEESWRDPDVRWLLSTVPSAMIFDDHDVHDDWNTSQAWRQDADRLSWWRERVIGALGSYWVYQHLGNLSPDELVAEPTFAALSALAPGEDGEAMVRRLAQAADREADGAKGYRWSFARDLAGTRIVVLDSRCGRILADGRRSMLAEAEFAWLERQVQGGYDHLVIGTSLPWLLAPALHDIEAWDERLAADPRPRRAALGERLRRVGDLEHWAAFDQSFHRLGSLLRDVARGSGRAGRAGDADAGGAAGDAARGDRGAPACVVVLSGDVHHSYVATLVDPGAAARIHQVTCSPLHNSVPAPMRLAFRISWSRAAERTVRFVLARLARVPPPRLQWRRTAGPFFGNAVSTLLLDGRRATLTIESSETDGRSPLTVLHAQDLTSTGPSPRRGP